MSYLAEQLRPLAVSVEDITPDPRNARSHSAVSINSIAESLRQFGMLKPIVVDQSSKQIVAGNGTYHAALKLGWTHVAVVWIKADPSRRLGYAIADNRTAELAEWDEIRLAEAIGEIQDTASDLYDALLLADLLESNVDTSDGSGDVVPDETYKPTLGVFIECDDELQQEKWYELARKESMRCRCMTL